MATRRGRSQATQRVAGSDQIPLPELECPVPEHSDAVQEVAKCVRFSEEALA